MHKATNRFWANYGDLDSGTKRIADRNFEILKSDPTHPSLKFKKVGQLWSARVGLNHRALAVQADHGFTWVWIGTHSEYDKILSQPRIMQ